MTTITEDSPPVDARPAAGDDRIALLEARLERQAVRRDGWTLSIFVFSALALLASVIGVGFGMRAIDESKDNVAAGASAAGGTPTAVELSEFAISPNAIEASAGGLAITNTGSAAHDLHVDGTEIASPMIDPGGSARLDLSSLRAGPILTTLQRFVEAGGEKFAIPLTSVEESLRIYSRDIRTVERREVFTLRDFTLPLLRLADAFHLEDSRDHGPDTKWFVVVTRAGEKTVGLLVDALVRQQEVVIKSIGERLKTIPGIAGATEIGESEIVLVVDVGTLIDNFGGRAREARAMAGASNGEWRMENGELRMKN